MGGRNTGRHHKKDTAGKPFTFFNHVSDAGCSGNIGNFMGIADHRCGAVGYHCFGKLSGGKHGAFDMDMPFHESWTKIAASTIDLLPSLIHTDPCNLLSTDCDISIKDFTTEHIDDTTIFQHTVCRLNTSCLTDPPPNCCSVLHLFSSFTPLSWSVLIT